MLNINFEMFVLSNRMFFLQNTFLQMDRHEEKLLTKMRPPDSAYEYKDA